MSFVCVQVTWVSEDEERSRDLYCLLKLIRFGTVSSSNINHILGHPLIAANRKCRRLVQKLVKKPTHISLECEIPRAPISFVCLTGLRQSEILSFFTIYDIVSNHSGIVGSYY